jgi:hypothetical protein
MDLSTLPSPDRRLDFSPLLLTTASLDRQIGAALDRALSFMRRTTAMALFDEYVTGATSATRAIVGCAVVCVDHVGLIAPAGTNADDLHAVADAHGFTDQHRSFASVIVARELTALNDGIPVPTRIFRASAPPRSSEEPAYGIEVFVPDTHTAVVTRWIRQGVGTHAAFRVASGGDVDRLCVELQAAGLATPAFMGGKPMTNANDGTRTVYFDLPVPTGTFRLEFFYRQGR